jgi:hypothetical protein
MRLVISTRSRLTPETSKFASHTIPLGFSSLPNTHGAQFVEVLGPVDIGDRHDLDVELQLHPLAADALPLAPACAPPSIRMFSPFTIGADSR